MAPIFDALPSGKLTVCDIENGPVEIVDLPSHNMVIFHRFLGLFTRGQVPRISPMETPTTVHAGICQAVRVGPGLLQPVPWLCQESMDENNYG